ncbi:hypothetical protein D3C71_1895020 [compost metagenome]
MSYNICETRSITVLEVMNLLKENKAKLFKSNKSKVTMVSLNRNHCKLIQNTQQKVLG